MRAHARAALRAGFEPHVFCLSRRHDDEQTDFGTIHRTAPLWERGRAGRSPSLPNQLTGLYGRLLAVRVVELATRTGRAPEVIHAFGAWGCAALWAAGRLAARGAAVSPLMSAYTTLRHEFEARLRGLTRVHGPGRWLYGALDLAAIRLLAEPVERWAYRASPLVLVNYDSVRRLLTALAGPGLQVRQIPYAPETAFLDDGGPWPAPPEIAGLEPSDAPLVVAVSRQDSRKGVDILLRALSRLRARHVPFRACIVGGGHLLEPHRRLARRLGLGLETLQTGGVKDSRPYLRQADVFALPSLQEASGSVSLLEAFQAGVAVVASDVDGIPEDVDPGYSGLLVPPGDEEALARALERLIRDVALRHRLAAGGRATFDQRFSAGAFTSALAQVYEERRGLARGGRR